MRDKKRGSLSSPSKWIYFSSLLASFVSTAVRVSAVGLTITIIINRITTGLTFTLSSASISGVTATIWVI